MENCTHEYLRLHQEKPQNSETLMNVFRCSRCGTAVGVLPIVDWEDKFYGLYKRINEIKDKLP